MKASRGTNLMQARVKSDAVVQLGVAEVIWVSLIKRDNVESDLGRVNNVPKDALVGLFHVAALVNDPSDQNETFREIEFLLRIIFTVGGELRGIGPELVPNFSGEIFGRNFGLGSFEVDDLCAGDQLLPRLDEVRSTRDDVGHRREVIAGDVVGRRFHVKDLHRNGLAELGPGLKNLTNNAGLNNTIAQK